MSSQPSSSYASRSQAGKSSAHRERGVSIATDPLSPFKSSDADGSSGEQAWIAREPRPAAVRQLKKSAAPASAADEGVASSSDSSVSMPGEVQARMEQAFQTDFSDVKLHEGQAATSIGAHAFTQGNAIHFEPGRFDPSGQSGQELLGHELAHVVQQRQGRVAATTTLGKGLAVNDSQALEHEADEMGARAARGQLAVQGAVPKGGGLTGSGQPIQGQFYEKSADGKYEWHDEDPDDRFKKTEEVKKSGTGKKWPVYVLAGSSKNKEKPKDEKEVMPDVAKSASAAAPKAAEPAAAASPMPAAPASPMPAVAKQNAPKGLDEKDKAKEKEKEQEKAGGAEPGWFAQYRKDAKAKGWQNAVLEQNLVHLKQELDGQAAAFKSVMDKLIPYGEEKDSKDSKGNRDAINAEIAAIRKVFPEYSGKLDEYPLCFKARKDATRRAAEAEARARRGWNYLAKVEDSDVWWRQLPPATNDNIKKIAEHAGGAQHTSDHRPDTVAAFQTALRGVFYKVANGRVLMSNGSGHEYDDKLEAEVSLSYSADALARVYQYAYDRGSLHNSKTNYKGGFRKSLQVFPVTVAGKIQTITLQTPLVVIVNTTSNDLKKDPGTAFVKDS